MAKHTPEQAAKSLRAFWRTGATSWSRVAPAYQHGRKADLLAAEAARLGVSGETVRKAWAAADAFTREQVDELAALVVARRATFGPTHLVRLLALRDCLAVAGLNAGQRIPQYLRDHWAGTLHKLGVEIIPYARLYGIDGSTAYFQHIASGEPILFEGTDTLVLSQGHESHDSLSDALAKSGIETHRIGDCLAPRTAEEAVLEGLKVGSAL